MKRRFDAADLEEEEINFTRREREKKNNQISSGSDARIDAVRSAASAPPVTGDSVRCKFCYGGGEVGGGEGTGDV